MNPSPDAQLFPPQCVCTAPVVTGKSPEKVTFTAEWDRDVRAERKAAFTQFWRSYHRGFYDPNFHGRDWVAIRDRYEPLLDSALIRRIADLLAASPDAAIATACHPIVDLQEAFNPNVVKVALDGRNHALYFSRATIPWAREAFGPAVRSLPPDLPLYRHYGLYAYRVDFLTRYPSLESAPIERFEALEQLRALWHGYKIVVEITTGTPAPGIDTPADLEQARAVYAANATPTSD